MTRTLTMTAVVVAALLAGCDNSDHTIVAGEPYDPQANAVQNLQNVELPPAIAASKSYRCGDNSLLFIDWYSDGSARVKMDRAEAGIQVPAPAEGASPAIEGSATTASVTYNGKTCKS